MKAPCIPRVFCLASLLAVGLMPRSGAGAASAQQQGAVSIVTDAGKCLRPVADEAGAEIRTGDCRNAPALRLVQGAVRTPAGLCLDWINEGGPVHLAACRPGRKSQRWQTPGSRALRNVQREDLCMDVEGGEPGAGARVLVWRCQGAGASPPNQRFRLQPRRP